MNWQLCILVRICASSSRCPHSYAVPLSLSAPTTSPVLLVLSTLYCPVCRNIFLSPVATCGNGHVVCSTCVSRLKTCGVCGGDFRARRNVVIEKQLTLVSVNCSFHLCGEAVRADQIYEHLAFCQFRDINCTYHVSSTVAGCREQVPFHEYFEHLVQIHNCRTYAHTCPGGAFPCHYRVDAQAMDGVICYDSNPFLAREREVAGTIYPMPILRFGNIFLLNCFIQARTFHFWVTALLSEADACDYFARVELADRRQYENEADRLPIFVWRVRVHNVHTPKHLVEAAGALVNVPYSTLKKYCSSCYATNPNGDVLWTVLCGIEKGPEQELQPELEEEQGFGDLVIVE